MTTHRRYTFTHEGPIEPGWDEWVLTKLTRATDECWWFEDPTVTVTGSQITFAIQVSARDQWFAHKRVMALAEDICWALKIPVPEPVWTPLPPHTNRGRYRTESASNA